ncbi:MAG: response regulator [Gemmatimonadaceae bacterium]
MRRVAIIDRNPDHRVLFRVLLEGRYRCSEYDNGEDAIVGMRTRPPDVILMDLSLTSPDSAGTLQQIRGDPRLSALPVVAVAPMAGDAVRERVLSAGYDEFFKKPILDESVLHEVLQRAMDPARVT